jgi:hypothetical protein
VAYEELQKIYELFMKKYPNGEMTRQEFIAENLRLNGGSESFWEEMFEQFTSKKTGRINVKGAYDNSFFVCRLLRFLTRANHAHLCYPLLVPDFILNYALILNGTPEEKLTCM